VSGSKEAIMRRTLIFWAAWTCLAAGVAPGPPAPTPLSDLRAGAGAPLFTTYCAARERSEFTLDEGYHLVYDDPGRGVVLETDSAGDWGLAFRMGARTVDAVGDFARAPEIDASYADCVRCSFEPFAGIRVEVAFVVHSSRQAVQAITIRNQGAAPAQIQVVPYLNHRQRTFEQVVFLRDAPAVTAVHEELPDDWTREHRVPYVDRVRDLLLLSRAPDRLGSYRGYRWGPVALPAAVDLSKPQEFRVWGRIDHADGSRCRHDPAGTRLMAVLGGDRSRLITETAACWGTAGPNLSPYGYYGLELGNFGTLRDGETYEICAACGPAGETGRVSGSVGDLTRERGVRRDITLAAPSGPAPPAGLKRDIWGSGTEVRLYWPKAGDGVTYSVYRRDGRGAAVYQRLAEGLTRTFYTDRNLAGDPLYGYVVTAVDGEGRMSLPTPEVTNIEGSDLLTDLRYPGQIPIDARDRVRVLAAPLTLSLAPGAAESLRVVRAVGPAAEAPEDLVDAAKPLLAADLGACFRAAEAACDRVPRADFGDPDTNLLYWSAWNLMRQVMLPPEGKCRQDYYVFSREPSWGWGHGGQVFHESLTMLAYTLADPAGAMGSQRVFAERQRPDGYINYRTGPYLDETIVTGGQPTCSAPWYAWTNWEVYRLTRDRRFLEEMYPSSRALYDWFLKNRDTDGDGLAEWGGDAVLESVRDARVAVWDEVGDPANVEALDLNCCLVQEARALTAMAAELGRTDEAARFREEAEARAKRINAVFWDEATGFYYHVDKADHDFTLKAPGDLKRREIIGFLPLWAGIATPEQAKRLAAALADPNAFGRRYGVPSLAADDPYYNPRGYWNGPVWVEWNLLVQQGLRRYGYERETRELAARVAAGMIERLKRDHDFWEFYSPDEPWGGYHRTYIWAGCIARMLLESRRPELFQ
jgi:hypothetical protein